MLASLKRKKICVNRLQWMEQRFLKVSFLPKERHLLLHSVGFDSRMRFFKTFKCKTFEINCQIFRFFWPYEPNCATVLNSTKPRIQPKSAVLKIKPKFFCESKTWVFPKVHLEDFDCCVSVMIRRSWDYKRLDVENSISFSNGLSISNWTQSLSQVVSVRLLTW